MTSLVEHLKQWSDDIQLESKLNELKIGTYQKYKDAAVKSANKHTDQGDFKAHQSGDEAAGEHDYDIRNKRKKGITKANKMIGREKRKEKQSQKKEPLLKPVSVAKEPDLVQRVKKLAGLS